MLEGGCPYCGESLVIKRGKYGEFIACSEWCGYTKSVVGRSEYPPPKITKRPCPYNKCDGSGLVPFVGKDGKVRNDAHIFCDCHSQYGIDVIDHYHEPRLEDYDFPMSSDFRAWAYQYCGVLDPYIPSKPRIETEIQPIFKPRPVDKEIDQLKAGYIHLQNKLNGHLDKSKIAKNKDRI